MTRRKVDDDIKTGAEALPWDKPGGVISLLARRCPA